MNRNVTPWARRSRIRLNSRLMPAPSSWAVGSSRMMNRAPKESARAISTNCRCSTVSVEAGWRTSTSTDHSASNCSASRRSLDQRINPAGPRACRLRNRFSATVRVPMMVDFW